MAVINRQHRLWLGTVCMAVMPCALFAQDVASVAPGDAVVPRQLRESRYQLGLMERVLEGAVEHGATVIRDRLQTIMPADMLLTDAARVRGFRLDGYGIFFDVEVPGLEGTLAWSFRTLNQNDLNVDTALQTLKAYIERSATDDINVQQALKRLEIQMAPLPQPVAVSAAGAIPAAAGGAAPSAPMVDPILTDPNEAYRTEVRDALVNAMLEHSRGLNLAPAETLTVAARRTDDRPRVTPVDTDARTVVLSLKGSDLNDFLAGRISRAEAERRVDVRVF
ncbi:MAG: hypothetical protein LBQ09_00190 [Acidobacteriaceae bacterium]|jgi:hypothetical protein|nr:hypothetical protein [Acidobacteriaceae bacterium]